MLNHSYANYFCQVLFIRLSDKDKHEIIINITKNFKKVIINTVSFKALITILETPLPSISINHLANIFKKLNISYYLEHSRYLKILECLLSNIKEQNANFIYYIVVNIFHLIINQKQGFFLIRKVIKTCKDIKTINSLIFKIINHNELFFKTNNGCTLYYMLLKVCFKYNNNHTKNNIDLTNNKTNYNSFNDYTNDNQSSFTKKLVYQANKLANFNLDNNIPQNNYSMHNYNNNFIVKKNFTISFIWSFFNFLCYYNISGNNLNSCKLEIMYFKLINKIVNFIFDNNQSLLYYIVNNIFFNFQFNLKVFFNNMLLISKGEMIILESLSTIENKKLSYVIKNISNLSLPNHLISKINFILNNKINIKSNFINNNYINNTIYTNLNTSNKIRNNSLLNKNSCTISSNNNYDFNKYSNYYNINNFVNYNNNNNNNYNNNNNNN